MAEEDEADAPVPSTSAVSLSDAERAVLTVLRSSGARPMTDQEVAAATGLPAETARGSLQRLRSKGLVLADEEHRTAPVLTRKGEDAFEHGLPERRLLERLRQSPGAVSPESLTDAGFTEEERSAAIGMLRRGGYLEDGVPLRLKTPAREESAEFSEESTLGAVGRQLSVDIDSPTFRRLARRGLVAVERSTTRRWTPSDEGRTLTLETAESRGIGMLTPNLLATGEWRRRPFRPYDVRASVPFIHGARSHPYLEWIREFEEILVGLGFEEAEGPLVETEFWNADVLFMPQDHPARSIHDMLTVRGVRGQPPPSELLDRVAAAHEGRPIPPDPQVLGPGWRAPYDRSRATRDVARSQTTAVSARFLAARPHPPFRMYSIGRNFRYESVDATHHIEFDQCEGILGAAGINVRHLIGLFRSVAQALRLEELRFRPSYFPFTEPSIEGYAHHPTLGWVEIFPGGIFRPEVTRPLGVDVPVAAWGIGVTRLAMVALGVTDIRDLYVDDLARLTAGSG